MLKKILRLILAAVSVIFLVWFIAPVCWGIWHIGNIAGIMLCLVLFFRTACVKLYNQIKIRMCSKTATKVLLRIVQIGMTAIAIYCVAVSSYMIYAMAPWDSDDSATAIVLGAQVKSYGPTTILRQRIQAGEAYLNDHPDAKAVLSGGQGADEPTSEAECMYAYMMKDGIASDRLYQENQAKNTDENIRFSLKIIEDNGLNRNIAIVSDSYHQLRARIIAHKIDRDLQITPVNTKNTQAAAIAAYPSYFVREWIAIPVEIIK